ncbi:MAG: hypothetical protein JO142_11150 [Burkholderiales bacterium]|nr:hypothetical protein [Burkholderiales bacterium]
MHDYSRKSYGRAHEVAEIKKLFDDGKDVSMHGPRRLGKTFVLDRMAEYAAGGDICLKVELAGCTEPKAVFRRMCEEITRKRSIPRKTFDWVTQRVLQVTSPRTETGGAWYQNLLNLDWETYFERLINAINEDKAHRWLVLIDELPIFLKALHDKGADGEKQARDFMNYFTRLRAVAPRVRWLITGSIGIEPLARAGQYLGTLSKFTPYLLLPLTVDQARDYIQDLAFDGALPQRQTIPADEADAVVAAVGWRAAYYLEAFARVLPVQVPRSPEEVASNIAAAHLALLEPHHTATFGTWEEHIRKHQNPQQQMLSFAALKAIAQHQAGLTLDTILGAIQSSVDKDALRQHLQLLVVDGFLHQQAPADDGTPYAFRIPLLRLWWQRWPAAV